MKRKIDVLRLNHKPHPAGISGTQAIVKFPNGYGASVITGPYFYSRPSARFEIAVLRKDGGIDYTTPITDDVLGYLTIKEANKILAKIAQLPPCK